MNTSWCDKCDTDVPEDILSVIYVDNIPVYVCEPCLDKHFPLV